MGPRQASKTGQPGKGVHGVLHRLRPLDLARLTHMEHEYRSVTLVKPSYLHIASFSPMHVPANLSIAQ